LSKNTNIKLLVIPELFPYFKGDWRGVFILDYIKSVLKSVETLNVLFVKLVGDKKGVFTEKWENYQVKRIYCTDKPLSGLKKILGYICFFKKGNKLSANIEANIIHVHGSLFTGNLARIIAHKKQIPYVVSEHTGPYSRIANHWLYPKMARKTYKNAVKILTVSHYQKQQLVNFGVPESKITVTYNPVDTNLFKPDTNKPKKQQIVFISRLDKFKGAMKCLKAFYELLPENNNWHLVICGEGEEKTEIEKFISDNKIGQNVTLKPMQTRQQMAVLFQESAFSVFLSLHETFGLVAAESIACGTPVLCSNTTSLPEIVTNKEGILVNPDNFQEIKAAMQTLLHSYKSFKAEDLHQTIEKRFGLRIFGENLSTIYKNILAN
jgi:glycosyltransferase involved in cell wall biosynthesis